MQSVAAQRGFDHSRPCEPAHRQTRRALCAAAAIVGLAAVAVQSTPVASASSPSVVGKKYSDARGTLSSAGFSIVVATTVGDRLPCQQDRSVPPPENTAGAAMNETQLSLNCDAAVASATSPGNSLGSPDGAAAAAAAAAKGSG
jgi:hypothetical protein